MAKEKMKNSSKQLCSAEICKGFSFTRSCTDRADYGIMKGLWAFSLLGILAVIIQYFQITYLLELKIDTILILSAFTILALSIVLKCTDKEALIRRGSDFSRRSLIIGTVLLICANTLGLLVYLLTIHGSISLSGITIGLLPLGLILVTGPLFEEFIFREVLIGKLRRFVGNNLCGSSGSVYMYVAISALTFGFLHGVSSITMIERSLEDVLHITYGGFLYGIGYIKYGLAIAILLHASNNILAVFLSP